VGREYVETLTDAALLDIARAELRNVLGIEAPPLLTRINRFDRAMPQYTIGHNARIARILAAASRIPGLEMAGAIYTGLGIPDCVRSGVDAADRAVAALPSGTPTLSALST
ncbi:MAG TPA: FAD-dependent oxidoreductase, partial [Acidimicrobiia bacterium]|nr:FAD-dependent oxidoreductase [Acidimicrobiia bacterium]